MTPQSKITPFDASLLEPPSFPDQIVDVTDFGARDNGRTSNTEAFRRAIKKCAADGGGTVRVPPGLWLTGPIHLLSNVCLHLEPDAIVRFSTKAADYLPVVFTRWEGIEGYNYSPFIYAKDCTNIAVTGQGVFEGQGHTWWHWRKRQYQAAKNLYDAQHNGIPVEKRVFGREEDALRPQFFQPIQCSNVLIEGVTFKNGPMWTIHPVYCQDLIVRNVTVLTDVDGHNTDGLNPDSCRNVLIEHCRFSTGDDCIAINSGMNEDGWRVNKPCENILIRNCRMEKGHGGVVIGSAMSGGIRNVYAHDCSCDGTDVGIRVKSRRGRGGIVENIRFEDFRMTNIRQDAVLINMFYAASTVLPNSEHPPLFRNIAVRNLSCQGASRAVHLHGLPECPIQNFSLKNAVIRSEEGIVCDWVDGLVLENVDIDTQDGSALGCSNVQRLQTTAVNTTARSLEETTS